MVPNDKFAHAKPRNKRKKFRLLDEFAMLHYSAMINCPRFSYSTYRLVFTTHFTREKKDS